jgi:hypothetical protein
MSVPLILEIPRRVSCRGQPTSTWNDQVLRVSDGMNRLARVQSIGVGTCTCTADGAHLSIHPTFGIFS